MVSAFRFRLYPSSKQSMRMLRALEASRGLWNDALAHRKSRWEQEKKSTSYQLQTSMLTLRRAEDPMLNELYSQAGQDVLRRLDKAFKAFFAHRASYPRFKKFRQSGSFTYPQAYKGCVSPDVVGKRLFISKIGNVRAVFHRPLPRYSRLKTCTVKREPDGKWFASLIFEETVPLQNIAGAATKQWCIGRTPIGIDSRPRLLDHNFRWRDRRAPSLLEKGREAREASTARSIGEEERVKEPVQGEGSSGLTICEGRTPASGFQSQTLRPIGG